MSRRQKNRKFQYISRSGFVLYIVAIVLAILSLGGITLLALMNTEYEATIIRTQELQLSSVNRSAVVLMESILELTPQERAQYGGLYDNPQLFCNIPVLSQEEGGKGNARFTILSPKFDDEKITGVRYGLVNESSRLNLAAVLQWDESNPGTGRRSLMKLPGMTSTMADSILDWIDADEQSRPRGAEATYYSRKNVPYSPRNALPVFLEELLLVRDVTRLQLYGTDEEFNYNNIASQSSESTVFDANSLYFNDSETDNSESEDRLAGSNATNWDTNQSTGSNSLLSPDAILNETISESANVYKVGDVPWVQYLTVFSAEKDVDPSGEPRIDLNGSDLAFLYDELSKYVDEKTAEFVVLYRQFGPATSEQIQSTTLSTANPISDNSALDFSISPSFRLETPLDIIGATVIVPLNGNNNASSNQSASAPIPNGSSNGQSKLEAARIVESPFSAKRSMADELFSYLDYVSTSYSTVILGRVNINEAPRTVLETIPDLTSVDVQKIINSRPSLQERDLSKYRHAAWLYTEGVVNLAKMKKIWSKTTTGGDVYRGQIVSFMEDQGANRRGEVVVDNTVSPPRQVFYKDLSMYGQGYSQNILTGKETRNIATDNLVQLMQQSSYSSSNFPDIDFSTSTLDPMEFIKQNEIPSVETASQTAGESENAANATTGTSKTLNKRQELLQKLKELRQPISKTTESNSSNESTIDSNSNDSTASPETQTTNVQTTSKSSDPAAPGSLSESTVTNNQESASPNRRQQLLQTLRENRRTLSNSKPDSNSKQE
ncbi:MAG: type II secretion system protein GspK [Planctomycetia bacterium]|nr:type II secretion system protein GspK [Planctomycetia bacterium]